MNVYVVAKYHAYEGYSEPLGVFSCEHLAKVFMDGAKAAGFLTDEGIKVFELKVVEPVQNTPAKD